MCPSLVEDHRSMRCAMVHPCSSPGAPEERWPGDKAQDHRPQQRRYKWIQHDNAASGQEDSDGNSDDPIDPLRTVHVIKPSLKRSVVGHIFASTISPCLHLFRSSCTSRHGMNG